MPAPIRILTYNIRGGLGVDNRRSIRRIAQVIREAGPQVVCMQEVHQRLPWSRMVDQPRFVGRSLGMSFCFQQNLSVGVGGFGNAILTSFEIVRVRSYSLTSKREQRGAIEAHLVTSDGPVTVFCTHFGLDAQERVGQAGELAALVNVCDCPRIVCADFNEESDGAAVMELIKSAGLVDAAAGGPPTFNSESPSHRIDMILCDPSVRVCSFEVPDTQASDHLPLIADVELPVCP